MADKRKDKEQIEETPNFIIRRVRVNGRWVTVIVRRPPVANDDGRAILKRKNMRSAFVAADGDFITADNGVILLKY